MISNRKVSGVGFRLIIRSGSVTEEVQKATIAGLKLVGEQYKNQIKKTIGLTDHSLEDLKKLGYPYRHGGDVMHGDDRLVHRQSGQLYNSIRLEPVEQETSRRFLVYVTSSDPIMPFLIYGTSTMRPRRFHEKAYEDIKAVYWDPLLKELKKVNIRVSTWES